MKPKDRELIKLKLSQLVALLEDDLHSDQRELSELKATMIVNFGSEKRKPKILNNLKASALTMFMKIAEYYQARVKELEKQIKQVK